MALSHSGLYPTWYTFAKRNRTAAWEYFLQLSLNQIAMTYKHILYMIIPVLLKVEEVKSSLSLHENRIKVHIPMNRMSQNGRLWQHTKICKLFVPLYFDIHFKRWLFCKCPFYIMYINICINFFFFETSSIHEAKQRSIVQALFNSVQYVGMDFDSLHFFNYRNKAHFIKSVHMSQNTIRSKSWFCISDSDLQCYSSLCAVMVRSSYCP